MVCRRQGSVHRNHRHSLNAGRIAVNTWPGIGVDGWLKAFDGTTPLTAQYQSWVTYKREEQNESQDRMPRPTPSRTTAARRWTPPADAVADFVRENLRCSLRLTAGRTAIRLTADGMPENAVVKDGALHLSIDKRIPQSNYNYSGGGCTVTTIPAATTRNLHAGNQKRRVWYIFAACDHRTCHGMRFSATGCKQRIYQLHSSYNEQKL